MRSRRSTRHALLALALLGAALRSAPAAADAFTPVFIADDGEIALCHVLNVGAKAISVRIEIRFPNGSVASASELLEVLPGENRSHSIEGTNSSRFYCAFLGKLKPKTVRLAGEVLTGASGGDTKVIVPGF
jgi:hypothetical protein